MPRLLGSTATGAGISQGVFCRSMWPRTADQHAYMKMRQAENLARCETIRAEQWALSHLKGTNRKWNRQAQWGYRLFDFWCHDLGIAVEIDGETHDADYDAARDARNYQRSGILVLRVRNYNEEDMERALAVIASSPGWNTRRAELGLKPITSIPMPS